MREQVVGTIVGVLLFLPYGYGLYKIIADDHRYTTKEVVIGLALPPYALWVGGRELYRIATVLSDDRVFEAKCLDASAAIGMERTSRLRYCECLVQTKEQKACLPRIFTQ